MLPLPCQLTGLILVFVVEIDTDRTFSCDCISRNSWHLRLDCWVSYSCSMASGPFLHYCWSIPMVSGPPTVPSVASGPVTSAEKLYNWWPTGLSQLVPLLSGPSLTGLLQDVFLRDFYLNAWLVGMISWLKPEGSGLIILRSNFSQSGTDDFRVWCHNLRKIRLTDPYSIYRPLSRSWHVPIYHF